MATWRLTVEKFLASAAEYWTNVYYFDSAAVTNTATFAQAVVDAERAVHLSQVTITKWRADDNTLGTDEYVTTPVNLPGLRAGAPLDTILPLFVTGRVDFAASSGRPSRKYLRGVLQESDVSMTSISGASLTALEEYASTMAGLTGYVDIDGQELVAGSVFPAPQMRQLRRGSKKKTTL